MPRIYVSIGSNIDRHASIRGGVAALAQRFGELELSSVYESEAVGFDGDNFYNMVAAFDSDAPVGEVVEALRAIEDEWGRDRSGPRFSSRTLDIDLLLYGDRVGDCDGTVLPRDEITKNAFVLWPLAEIAPDALHPALGDSFSALWRAYDKGAQQLWPIPFDFAD